MHYAPVVNENTGREYGRKRVYDKGDGMRRRFHELLEPEHFDNPRKLSRNHGTKWYLNGRYSNRPIYGIYALAQVAEHYMYLVRFGKRQQGFALPEVARFYAATRRAMQNVLSTFGVNKRIPADKVDYVRSIYENLCKEAEVILQVFGESTQVNTKVRPFNTKLCQDDLELLNAILIEQSANGTIPKTSALFRQPTP